MALPVRTFPLSVQRFSVRYLSAVAGLALLLLLSAPPARLLAQEHPIQLEQPKEKLAELPPDADVAKGVGWPKTVTVTLEARFQSPFATMKIPPGRQLDLIRVTGNTLEVTVQDMRGTIKRDTTNLDDQLRKRLAASGTGSSASSGASSTPSASATSPSSAAATPVSASASPIDSTATSKAIIVSEDVPAELGLLVNFRMPLSKPLRQAAIQYAAKNDRWLALSRGMSEPLVSDVRSGYVDQPGWRDRLVLATIFSWLGRTEEKAMMELATRPVETNGISLSRQPKMDRTSLILAMSTSGNFRSEMLSILLGPDKTLWPPADKSRTVGSRFSAESLEELLLNREFCDALIQSVSDKDYLPGVFNVLTDLHKLYPQDFFEYQNLAIAMAIVYDVAPPPDWPHNQIKEGALAREEKPWRALFGYFVEKDKSKSLLSDIKTLPADQLKFLVDAPIPISELEWASQNITMARPVFDKLYNTIHYDMARFREGRFDWESGPYRLEAIRRLGGICTDQSYYCYMSAKAKGLPSLLFTGIGVVAGHAWFGYLRAEGWYMNAGRGSEPTGQAMDPQTWRPISDTELAFISGRQNGTTAFQYSRNMLLLTQLPVRELTDDNRRRICRLAIESAPDIPASWYAVADLLASDVSRASELRTHYRSMSDQFGKQLDIWAEVQRKLAKLERSTGSEARAKSIEEELLRSRSDIALDTARDILHRLVDNRDTDGALRRYRTFVQDYAKLGGMTFYRIVLPFTADLFRSIDGPTALKALEGAAECVPTDPESPVRVQYAGAMTWLTKEISGVKTHTKGKQKSEEKEEQ